MCRLVMPLLLLASCSRVPEGVCFFDEACADGGVTQSGGGGAEGGGAQSGGGAQGGGGGSAPSGGGSAMRIPIEPRHAFEGIPFDFAQFNASLPAPGNAPNVFDRTVAPLPSIRLSSAPCVDAFRGAVLIPDLSSTIRVVLVPACAEAFVEVDTLARTATPILGVGLAAPSTSAFGGAVLGCDLRAYVLPDEESRVRRLSFNQAGQLEQTSLPSFSAPPHLHGGVVTSTCATSGPMRIIAAGRNGIFALDVYEDVIDVQPVTTTNSASVNFSGVARIGDDYAITSFARLDVTRRVAVVIDVHTLAAFEVLDAQPSAKALGATFGTANTMVTIGPGGRVVAVLDGGIDATATRLISGTTQARWPVNGLDGFIYVAGESLVAVDTDGTRRADSSLIMLPGGAASSGLISVPGGQLVVVPGSDFDGGISILTPATVVPVPDALYLSPWLNKL